MWLADGNADKCGWCKMLSLAFHSVVLRQRETVSRFTAPITNTFDRNISRASSSIAGWNTFIQRVTRPNVRSIIWITPRTEPQRSSHPITSTSFSVLAKTQSEKWCPKFTFVLGIPIKNVFGQSILNGAEWGIVWNLFVE
jgi:hypothetical protein